MGGGPWRARALAALSIAVATTGVIGCGDAGDDDAIRVRDPVTAFAPLVRIHPRESLFPTSPARYLENASLHWAGTYCPEATLAARVSAPALGRGGYRHRANDDACRPRGRTYATDAPTHPYLPARGRRGLPVGQGFYLAVPAAARRGEPPDPQRTISRSVPAYFETGNERVGDESVLRISYWLFYGRSVENWLEWWPVEGGGRTWSRDAVIHDGDWERVDVLLTRTGDGYRPEALLLPGEPRPRRVDWDAVGRFGDTHPVVYGALGSHRLYARAGFHQLPKVDPTGNYVITDDAAGCVGCPRWRTWRRLLDLRDQPWHGYGGAWGDPGSTASKTGPTGPR